MQAVFALQKPGGIAVAKMANQVVVRRVHHATHFHLLSDTPLAAVSMYFGHQKTEGIR